MSPSLKAKLTVFWGRKLAKREGARVSATEASASTREQPIYLAYALPRPPGEVRPHTVEAGTFIIRDLVLGADESFLDFEGVVLTAGAFEGVARGSFGDDRVRYNKPDLDRREREFHTLFDKRKVFIFLVPPIIQHYDHNTDLVRRVLRDFGIDWQVLDRPVADIESDVPEFRRYIERYGSAHVAFKLPRELLPASRIISGGERYATALVVLDRLFFLPCHAPSSHQAALDCAQVALECTLEYRKRVSQELPQWISAFDFSAERELRSEADESRARLRELEVQISKYVKLKGALCLRSKALVDVVLAILRDAFGLRLDHEEEFIEDARLLDEAGQTTGVIEIKGVNRNFKGKDVNQVDTHREDRGLPGDAPAILIMNSCVSATGLKDKDIPPHPNVIKKAIGARVLLIRTLDLLRCVDLLEQGKLTSESFGEALTTRAGWLTTSADDIMIREA